MSTQPATAQAASTATAQVSEETTATAQPATTGQASQSETAAAPVKRQKLTDRIVATLGQLEGEGASLTISELAEKMSDVKRETLQATLSQLVKAKRVAKQATGKRQPGYRKAN